jgi:hypothetical protein
MAAERGDWHFPHDAPDSEAGRDALTEERITRQLVDCYATILLALFEYATITLDMNTGRSDRLASE